MKGPLLRALTDSKRFKKLPKLLQNVELQDYAWQKKTFRERMGVNNE